jgi:hypothetical protein
MNSKDLYLHRCADPEQWMLLARALKETAKPLEDKLGLIMGVRSDEKYAKDVWLLYKEIDVLYMLWGFSIENLIKAVIVKQNATAWFCSLNKLPDILNEHNLSKLLESAGLENFFLPHSDLLAKLTESIYWYGRYPVPKGASDYEKNAFYTCALLASSHVDDMNKIYEFLADRITKIE